MTVTVRPAHTSELPAVGELTVAAYRADGHLVEDDPYVPALLDTPSRAREAELYVAELLEAAIAVEARAQTDLAAGADIPG